MQKEQIQRDRRIRRKKNALLLMSDFVFRALMNAVEAEVVVVGLADVGVDAVEGLEVEEEVEGGAEEEGGAGHASMLMMQTVSPLLVEI